MPSSLSTVVIAVLVAVILLDLVSGEVTERLKALPRWLTTKISGLIPEDVRDRETRDWFINLQFQLADAEAKPITRLWRGTASAVSNLALVDEARARNGYGPSPDLLSMKRISALFLGLTSLLFFGLVALAVGRHVQAPALEWVYYTSLAVLLASLAFRLIRPWRLASTTAWLGISGLVLVWYAGCCLNPYAVQMLGAAVAGIGAVSAVAQFLAPARFRDRLGLGLIGVPVLAAAETVQRALAAGIGGAPMIIVVVLLIWLTCRLGRRGFEARVLVR